ncbi:MAG: hypothetical protein HKN94_08855 [Acidimicrobiales bacterium]|nr:hypothetical protein [Acidimicrobiales bacterium]RZV47936.1 MAG: hypothetical protein EX269_03665 [Acidimicrobiales bacterium]
MFATLAAIGFDPEIRGILVVATGAIVLFGSVWLMLATNSGVRLGTLIALSSFFGWMVIMGLFWWIRGIGFVGESVSWEVLDYNRGNISSSSVEVARDLPEGAELKGLGLQVAELGLEAGVTEMAEFTEEPDRTSEDFSGMTDEEFEAAWLRAFQRSTATTLSQVMSVAPDFVEAAEVDGPIPDLNGWEIMNTAEAGEAQSTAGAGIVEHEGFDFESQNEFRFLDAFRIGGKPRLDRDIDPVCTFCADNLRRGWHWIANSARIKNPSEYSVVQLQAVTEESLVSVEGEAPRFAEPDENAPIISVVMIRDLGNLRFPPAMITVGSLIIFLTLAYMMHVRDLESMARVEEFEAEG